MNLGDLIAHVADSAQEPPMGRNRDRILRSIAIALGELAVEQTDFNVSELSFVTVLNESSYGPSPLSVPRTGELPRDFLGLVGGLATSGAELREIGVPEMRRRLLSPSSPTTPFWFTQAGTTIELAPSPAAGIEVTGRYQQDLGTPEPRTSGGSVGLYVWDELVDDSWSVAWFDQAWDVVAARAGVEFASVIGDDPGRQRNMESFVQALARLKRRRGLQLTAGRVKPFRIW